MDSSVILVYVGDHDGQRRHLINYPATDITGEQLMKLAAEADKSPAEMQAYLLAQDGVWALPEEVESATIETPSPEESEQAPGEAAPSSRRRRES